MDKQVHVRYIQQLDLPAAKQLYEYWLSEHLRLNGLYWGLTALCTMDRLEALPKKDVLHFVDRCYDARTGGYAPFPGHDAHILTTLSGLQILALYNEEMPLHKQEQTAAFVMLLRQDDGSFCGDEFGEVDTRFVFTSVYALMLLQRLTPDIKTAACDFVMRCANFDGGFGLLPGGESHAAQMYTCLGTLALCGQLARVPAKTAVWLCERQVLPSGGFNGRPEKLPDVCYSWWVLLCLAMLGKRHWVSGEHLEKFILACQDAERGGFSDRPGNEPDVFHTCFALAGLALVCPEKYALQPVDPVLCLPAAVARRIVQ